MQNITQTIPGSIQIMQTNTITTYSRFTILKAVGMCIFPSNSHATHVSPSKRYTGPFHTQMHPKRTSEDAKHNPKIISRRLNSNRRHNLLLHLKFVSNLQERCRCLTITSAPQEQNWGWQNISSQTSPEVLNATNTSPTTRARKWVSLKYTSASNSDPEHKKISRRKVERWNIGPTYSRRLMRKESGREIDEWTWSSSWNFADVEGDEGRGDVTVAAGLMAHNLRLENWSNKNHN